MQFVPALYGDCSICYEAQKLVATIVLMAHSQNFAYYAFEQCSKR